MFNTISRIISRRTSSARSAQLKRSFSDTVQDVAEKTYLKDPYRYIIMGAVFGGIGVGLPISYLYFFQKYELEWHRRLHDNNGYKVGPK